MQASLLALAKSIYYLHKARSTRHACIIVQHMHASYVILSAKHRNLYFFACPP